MTLTLYGIPNCDTVKKARTWLAGHGLAHDFHDFKKLGVSVEQLSQWCAAFGWEQVLNRAGTTFRALPDADKAGLTQAKAIALMQAAPSMIKRPVLAGGKPLLIGFKPEAWAAQLLHG